MAEITVTSSSFFIEGDYKILWSSSSIFEDGKTTILKEGFAERGSLAITSSFHIPEAPAGLYYVGFIRLGREEHTTFSFTIVPHLRVQPLSASPGSMVTVQGTGLPADSIAELTFDGTSISTNAITNKNGSFTTNFTVPSIPAGEHLIAAKPSKATTTIPPAIMLVAPSISVNPQIPQPNSHVTITGHGFTSNVLVSIVFNDTVITNSPATDDTGSFTYAFTLPESANSGSKFTAKDAIGNMAVFSGGGQTATPPPSLPPPSSPSPPQTPVLIPGLPSTTALPKPTPMAPREESFGLFGAQPVKFRWTQATSFAPNTISYILEVSENPEFSKVKSSMRAAHIAQTSFTLNMQPGTYYWRVKAVSDSGIESDWANSQYSFKVGQTPIWLLFVGIMVCLFVLYLLVRALQRRQSNVPSYYY